MWPAAVAALVGPAALVALGVRGLVLGHLLRAVRVRRRRRSCRSSSRGAQVRQGASGSDVLTALIGLVGRQRRRYGGYIVHLGIVLMFLGFAGGGLQARREDAAEARADRCTVGAFTVRHDALAVTQRRAEADDHRPRDRARGRQGDRQMTPAKWFFAKHEEEPTTEVAIRRGVAEDLYIVLAGYERRDAERDLRGDGQSAGELDLVRLRRAGVRHRPRAAARARVGVRRRRRFRPARRPRRCCSAAPAGCRRVAGAQTVDAAQRVPRQQLEAEMMCKCGGCKAPMNNCPMGPGCHGLQEQQREARQVLSAQGMNREQMLAAFVADYGGQDDSGGADRQGLQPAGVGVAVCASASTGAVGRRCSSRGAGRAAAADRRRAPAAPRRNDAALRRAAGR